MKKALLAVAVVSTIGYGAYRMHSSSGPAPADSEQLVLDRLWIDHIPKTETDTVQVFAAITEEPFGVFQATSQWRGSYEGFTYERGKDELRITYPQTRERETVKAVGRRCDEGSMDYCLELKGASRGVKKYYSRKGWELDGVNRAALEARSKALLEAID